MDIREIVKKFPFSVKVTKNLIMKGQKNLFDAELCIGALALKKGLIARKVPNIDIGWGDDEGSIYGLNEGDVFNTNYTRV